MTEDDLGLLQQALKGEIATTLAMDCNQDGVVNNQDTSCLAQQICVSPDLNRVLFGIVR